MTVQKVLVTGSSGRIGQVTAAELMAHGYTVTGADLTQASGFRNYITDLTDLGQVTGVMAGHDAVVHLGAIPSPASHPADVVYKVNVLSTFNVLEAALLLGIRKVVIASSVSAIGYAWRHRDFNPLYLPFDEDHPLLSQDAYGLSKMTGELLADGYVRRIPEMSITSLRFTLVLDLKNGPATIERMRQNPADSNSFWTYIDVRDAAQACRLSVEYDQPGHEAFLISAPDSYLDTPSVSLFEQYYPGIERIAPEFKGTMGAFDCRKAEQVLGFKAQYKWDQSLLG